MAKKNWCVKFNLNVTAEEYVVADTEEEAKAIVEKALAGSELADSLRWQFQRDLEDSYDFEGFANVEAGFVECGDIDCEPINDMLGSKNEINWGHATEEDLMAAHYTGDAYMAIPYYFYTYSNDDVVDDVAGSYGYYYKSPYDVDMTVVDVVRGVGEVPAEDGIRIGVRIIRDHFENGANTGTDMDNDIWFDDEKGEWNRDELRYF